MKLFAFLSKGALAAAAVAAGLNTGGWVHEQAHYRTIAPSSTSAHEEGVPTKTATVDPATPDSLFHYQFVAGERLDYALDAAIGGTGIESLSGPGNVAMEFTSDLHVLTESVDLAGNGNLSIGFDRVEMHGSFMDAPVNLVHSLAGTEYTHGNEHVSTANGDSIAGIPQLEFFNQPTKARVSPSGEVLQVDGAPGMDKLLSPEEILTSIEFPAGELDTGAQWTSNFAMPVPGVGSPAGATALNVLEGFQLFRGRYCGVIRQTLQADQADGTLASPESVLGDEMNFSMPEFRLSGENLIYFDVDNGQLIQADLNLNFTMRIGGQLKPVADLLNVYGSLLNELEGNRPSESPAQDALDLGVNIQATLGLLMD